MTEGRLKQELSSLLWVAVGAVPGALLRWHGGAGWTATLTANLLASLLLGSLLPLQQRHPRMLLLVGVGFCGSLSTFSTWMLDLSEALHQGFPARALIVLITNLAGGLLAVGMGTSLSRGWMRRAGQRR